MPYSRSPEEAVVESRRSREFFDYLENSPGFSLYRAATTALDIANEKQLVLDPRSISEIQDQLQEAGDNVKREPQGPKSLALRIETAHVLAPVTATIPRFIETALQQDGTSEYAGEYLDFAYPQLAEIGARGLHLYQSAVQNPNIERDLIGYLPEIALLMLRARSQQPAVPASAYNDYLNEQVRHDITTYDVVGGEVRKTDVQLKNSRPADKRDAAPPSVLTLYGRTHLHNDPLDRLWRLSKYKKSPAPLLKAMIDELNGHTQGSQEINKVTRELANIVATFHGVPAASEPKPKIPGHRPGRARPIPWSPRDIRKNHRKIF